MSKLFSVPKVGLYLDGIVHSTERRKQGETKVLILTTILSPFDAKLATALDPVVRSTLFKLNNPEPHPHLRAVEFNLGALALPRQRVHLFATPDTVKATTLIDQVRGAGLRVRTQKKATTFGLVLKLSFGPASSKELELVEHWRTTQRFATFEAAERDLELDPEDDEEEDEDDAPRRAGPMFDDDQRALDEKGRVVEGEEPPTGLAAAADTPDKEPARKLPPRNGPRSKRVH